MPPIALPAFDWPRYWCPRDGALQLDDDGLLLDPESEIAKLLSLQLPRLEELAHLHCLILLGEPGAGKSTEISKARIGIQDADGQHLFLDLSGYDSLAELRRDFIDAPEVQQWIEAGDGTLTVFLDSLDEALLEVGPLARWLLNALSQLPTERMRVRIACRTADWPPFLESQLRVICGGDSTSVYEIAPLRLNDVSEAAMVRGLDPDAFITEIRRTKAGALASKPLTLRFLLNRYASSGAFPASWAQLYRDGCRQLCEEQNEERRASRRAGQFPAAWRLAAATRIAAITVFGNRAATWTGVDAGDVPSSDVPYATMAGGFERLDRDVVEISEPLVLEALGTGLFSSRGERRLGWTHQTYAEFLAALWVAEHEMPLPQIEALIRHPGDPGGRVIPQLAETVAWLAGMDQRVRGLILEVEPEILLKSDVARATDEERARIVDGLIERAANRELKRPEFGTRPRYDRLLHPGLDAQLRAVITDHSASVDARELAIQIARSANLGAVQSELADMALDPSEPIELRVDATLALARVGDAETRGRLLPLATEPQAADVTDDLKGYALQATWPDHLTAEQLFSALTSPKRPSYHGGYTGFFYHVAARLETIATLTTALDWTRREEWTRGMVRVLPEAILLEAWRRLDQPDVREAFADAVIEAMTGYHRLIEFRDELEDAFVREVDAETEKRHLLVETILRRWDDETHPRDYLAFLLSGWNPSLLRADDLDWLLQRTLTADDQEGQRWARLLAQVFTPEDPHHVEIIYAHREHPLVGPVLGGWFEATPIDAPGVEEARQMHRRMERRQTRQIERIKTSLPSVATIRHALERIQGGEESAWVSLVQELSRSDPEAAAQPELANADPRLLPLWRELGEEDRVEILAAAEHFVCTCDPRQPGMEAWPYRVWEGWAGYRALRLMQGEAPGRLGSLPRDVWERWASVLVAIREWESGEDGQPGPAPLLSHAYSVVPDLIATAARDLLRAENAARESLFSAENLRPVVDGHLASVLAELLREGTLTESALGRLLRLLLPGDSPEVRDWVESVVREAAPRSRAGRRRTLAVIRAMLVCAPDGGWSLLWPILRKNTVFSREVALSAAHLMVGKATLARFSETQLAEMFRWLERHVPYAEDPHYGGIHSPTAADDARHWRDNVIETLVERATLEAVRELAALRNGLPHLDWLGNSVLRAREVMRRETWQSLEPEQILALGRDPRRRVVEDGDHLIGLLLESLSSFEADLHGETPALETLWDDLGEGRFRPKNEAHLSNAIARHLRRDLTGRGVVVGREVEIRQTRQRVGGGQTTDIHVDAVRDAPGGGRDVVSAIVEVKGSWNREILSAMRTQLVDGYLARNPQVRHGLYVVGWYLSTRWIDEPRKRLTRARGSLDDLRQELRDQASGLSVPEITVRACVINASWD